MNNAIFCKVFSVLCVLILSAKCTNKSNRCKDIYDTNLVTINDQQEPYWFVSNFGVCVNGNKVKDILAFTLHIKGPVINEISGFPNVTEILAESNGLQNLAPVIEDLPSLKSVSFAKNRISVVPKDFLVRSNPRSVIFSFNNISKIEDRAFGSNIEQLYVTCNELNNISSSWFVNQKKLQELYLGGNKITTIPDDMFKHFVKLSILELRNNQIINFGIGSLSGPTKMLRLNLGYNNISEIKANVFGDQISIVEFDIQYNRLSFLHQGMMDKIQIEAVKLWGNPWLCPCQQVINAWIAKNNKDFSAGITREEDPSCIYALSFKNQCVPFVDPELYSKFVETFDLFTIDICPKTTEEDE